MVIVAPVLQRPSDRRASRAICFVVGCAALVVFASEHYWQVQQTHRIASTVRISTAHEHVQRMVDTRESQYNNTNAVKLSREVHLLIGYFNSSSRTRDKEVLEAIMLNVENIYLAKIHIFFEETSPAEVLLERLVRRGKLSSKAESRIEFVATETQPTYSRFFEYANKKLNPGAIAVIANADIYFDHSLGCLGPSSSKIADSCVEDGAAVRPPVAYALSRRHAPACSKGFDLVSKKVFDLCEDYRGSHDAFIFTVPVHPHLIASTTHVQNRLGAENIVVFEFRRAGYVVKNPCKYIKAYHLHCTNHRVRITGARIWHNLSVVPQPSNVRTKNKFFGIKKYSAAKGYAPPKYCGPFHCGTPLKSPCLQL